VRQGYVSREAAHALYGVEFTKTAAPIARAARRCAAICAGADCRKTDRLRARIFRVSAARIAPSRRSTRALSRCCVRRLWRVSAISDVVEGRDAASLLIVIPEPARRARRARAEDTIVSVERAFEIVALLADAAEGASLADIARHLDINKAIAVKLLATLERLGIVWRDDVAQRYNLTYRSAISVCASCKRRACSISLRRG